MRAAARRATAARRAGTKVGRVLAQHVLFTFFQPVAKRGCRVEGPPGGVQGARG